MNAVMDNLKSQIDNMTTTISDLQKTAAMRECKIIDLKAENEELRKQRVELLEAVEKLLPNMSNMYKVWSTEYKKYEDLLTRMKEGEL
jgi:uncharacterized protein involved in exopolysaccharide biosynthesis